MTSKARLFYHKELKNGLIAKLSESQSHYIKNVMRLKPGDKISLFNSNYSRIMLQSSGHLATERPLIHFKLLFKFQFN